MKPNLHLSPSLFHRPLPLQDLLLSPAIAFSCISIQLSKLSAPSNLSTGIFFFFFGYDNTVNIWLFPDDIFNLETCYNRIILLLLSNSKERGVSLSLLPIPLQLSSYNPFFSALHALCN